jgi:hypothetical protein
VGTFASITLYAVLVLVLMTVAAAGFSLLGVWLGEQAEEPADH